MLIAQHVIYIAFLFALGSCVGSFLNVVVWRLPRGMSVVSPPSSCPKCGTRLAWYDNIPVLGWIKLGGKCRTCKLPISARYPIVEAITGLLFVFYYATFFIYGIGPCAPVPLVTQTIPEFGGEVVTTTVDATMSLLTDWPMYGLYMLMIAALLAASLIDAELFIIPIEIPWVLAGVGVLVHTIIDRPTLPGALSVGPIAAAMAVGGTVGLVVSLLLLRLKVIGLSFPLGEPLLDVDRPLVEQEIAEAKARGEEPPPLPPPYTRREIRAEMRKEMAFLLPPLVLALALGAWTMTSPGGERSVGNLFARHHWLGGLCGSLLGALVGGLVVWLTRILGTLGFGRVAMGLGDVHLMFGVGAVIGAGASTVAFFVAPFFGLLFAVYKLVTRTGRELPYGPFLSAASAAMLLFYCPIVRYLMPGFQGLGILIRQLVGME